ncbi:MAG TPA: hypothetical protein VGN06_06930 [Gaiellaceae bacterium]
MPIPTPIGVGPLYQPRPAMHAPCAVAGAAPKRVHLELFANGFAIVIPARVGVRSARCRAHEWTTTPTGVVHFDRPARLGDLFSVWGMPLGRARLLSFHGTVSLFRNGLRVRGDPRSLPLSDGDEIVLETGPFIPPHRSFLFPPR